MRIGAGGVTQAGGFSTPLNDRLGVTDGRDRHASLVARRGLGRRPHRVGAGKCRCSRSSASSACRPTSRASTRPRLRGRCGGNIDCKELVAGTTLFLPIPVDGALLSAGDGHAAQGDGEVVAARDRGARRAGAAHALRARRPRADDWPIAWTPEAWLTFGFDEDLDEAAALAIDAMLELMGREHGLERREALALASVVVDLRVTQLVNGARGIHARLAHDAASLDDNLMRCRRGSSRSSIVALFALTCGALAAAWMRGRLGAAAIVLFGVALVVWVAAFAAIATEFHGANNFATCESATARRSTTCPRSRSSRRRSSSRSPRSRCSSSRGSRWRARRAAAHENRA